MLELAAPWKLVDNPLKKSQDYYVFSNEEIYIILYKSGSRKILCLEESKMCLWITRFLKNPYYIKCTEERITLYYRLKGNYRMFFPERDVFLEFLGMVDENALESLLFSTILKKL